MREFLTPPPSSRRFDGSLVSAGTDIGLRAQPGRLSSFLDNRKTPALCTPFVSVATEDFSAAGARIEMQSRCAIHWLDSDGDATGAHPHSECHMVLFCADAAIAARIVPAMEKMVRKHREIDTLNVFICFFDQLRLPVLYRRALELACAVDVVFVATDSESALCEGFHHWLECWERASAGFPERLLALVSHRLETMKPYCDLANCAMRSGVGFIWYGLAQEEGSADQDLPRIEEPVRSGRRAWVNQFADTLRDLPQAEAAITPMSR